MLSEVVGKKAGTSRLEKGQLCRVYDIYRSDMSVSKGERIGKKMFGFITLVSQNH